MIFFDEATQEYYHSGLALRASGGIDFYFKFRLIESWESDPNKLTFIAIDCDFSRVLFKAWDAEKQ